MRCEKNVVREAVAVIPWMSVSLPIQMGEKLSRLAETMCKRMNRAALGVIGVWSRTVTQSNSESNDTTLRVSTLAVPEAQLSLSAETSGRYCNWRAAAWVRRTNFI